MAVRALIRFLLMTPLQITIFLMISLPLALLAGITTFFSVIFLSSRLLLVYVDLLVSVLFAATSFSNSSSNNNPNAIRLRSHAQPHPLTIPRSPPRSPPRSGGYRLQQQQSFTAPSSPNISRKRLAAGSYGGHQSQSTSSNGSRQASLSPPLVMKSAGSGTKGTTNGARSTPSTPFSANPPSLTYGYDGVRSKSGKKGPVRIEEPGEGYVGDYFAGVGSRS
ncbi:hypothetical protein ABW20_dc0104498 [Dactylellina cionopaga]|nr:hypothetical protein ABW20_dc0104498 [Dactylellina cionopaga]